MSRASPTTARIRGVSTIDWAPIHISQSTSALPRSFSMDRDSGVGRGRTASLDVAAPRRVCSIPAILSERLQKITVLACSVEDPADLRSSELTRSELLAVLTSPSKAEASRPGTGSQPALQLRDVRRLDPQHGEWRPSELMVRHGLLALAIGHLGISCVVRTGRLYLIAPSADHAASRAVHAQLLLFASSACGAVQGNGGMPFELLALEAVLATANTELQAAAQLLGQTFAAEFEGGSQPRGLLNAGELLNREKLREVRERVLEELEVASGLARSIAAALEDPERLAALVGVCHGDGETAETAAARVWARVPRASLHITLSVSRSLSCRSLSVTSCRSVCSLSTLVSLRRPGARRSPLHAPAGAARPAVAADTPTG